MHIAIMLVTELGWIGTEPKLLRRFKCCCLSINWKILNGIAFC